MIVRASVMASVMAVSTIISGACGVVYSSIDYPKNGDVIPSSAFVVRGWALECASGKQPPVKSVSLWNFNTNSWWIPTKFKFIPQYRHDVAVYFRDVCPAGDWSTGYELHVSPQPPPGRYRLYINWANYYGAKSDPKQFVDIDVAYD